MHVVGTAGHVDHGKSTLVQALTGIDPDRFEEEKRRGLTIDLGFAWCTLPSGREIGIVDVPGHERFIRNMLAGVGSIDAAIFVVAADEGWMPQSEEHLQILDFLGISHAVVALTKVDIASDVAALAEEDVRERLKGTSIEEAPIVHVSAATGLGLEELLFVLDEQLPDVRGSAEGRPRMFVDRSFTIDGAGTVVTGTLTRGKLSVSDEVTVLPDLRRARIRSLQTHGKSVDVADAPRRLAVNLVGLDRRLVERGDALVTDEWILSNHFAARIRAARHRDHRFVERGAYELFFGSAQVPCRLKFLEPADEPLAEVFMDEALPIAVGDRFVIRDIGRWQTVAGGIVLDQAPSRLRRGDEPALERLRAREGLDAAALETLIIGERGAIRTDVLEKLTGHRSGDATSRYVFAPGFLDDLERRVVDELGAFHEANPLAAGMPIALLQRAVGLEPEAADEVFGELQLKRSIVIDGNVVHLPQRGGTTLSFEQRSVADNALMQLRSADASPPAIGEVGLSIDLAKALERSGEVVFLTRDIAYPSEVWRDIELRVVGFITDNGTATVGQIRDAVGTTRKYAVPLLEKLDATGVTRRKGDVRELGPRGRELLS